MAATAIRIKRSPGVGLRRRRARRSGPGFLPGRHRRPPATACTTTGASRWCWSSTRRTTRRCAPSSSGRTPRISTSFEALGAAVLCLSPQDVASHEEFAASQRLRLPLLSDTDKAVGRAYGILGPLGFYRRSVFVVDRDGVIRFARRSLSNLTYRPDQPAGRRHPGH